MNNQTQVSVLQRHTQQYFESLFKIGKLKQISGLEGMYLRPGDVCLVKSENTLDNESHYIIITGVPIQKEHGLRPETITIMTPYETVTSNYKSINGLILLKLDNELAMAFLKCNGYELIDNHIVNTQKLQYA